MTRLGAVHSLMQSSMRNANPAINGYKGYDMYVKPKTLKFLLNIYPPYLGAGIGIDTISDDWRYAKVSMKLRWYNRNAVGSHFGGSLYSMVDPQLMLMLMQILGKDYFVWDKSASIEYLAPARNKVTAEVNILDSDLAKIRENTASGDKYFAEFCIEINDEEKRLIALVKKTIYIRKKPSNRE